jgi:hypothetical protein
MILEDVVLDHASTNNIHHTIAHQQTCHYIAVTFELVHVRSNKMQSLWSWYAPKII